MNIKNKNEPTVQEVEKTLLFVEVLCLYFSNSCTLESRFLTRFRSFGFQNNKNWQKQQYQRNRWNRGGHPPIKNRDASVTVRPEWKVIEEMDFPRLSKLSLPNVDDPKDL